MSEQLVTYERDDLVSVITMNRPKKRNALSGELIDALVAAFRKADEDELTSVVVLAAEGLSFCSGYDLGGADAAALATADALRWHAHLSPELAFEMVPWYMKKPVIASVQGHALGGGCELAMFCDLTIAADNAMFGEPEVRFSKSGPGMVMPWIIGYKRARELLYLGDMIDAETALRYGMVNKVVPLDELKDATNKYAKRLSLISRESLVQTKLAISRGADVMGFRGAMQAGLDVLAPLYAQKTEVGKKFDQIAKESGVGAAVKWRSSHFE